MYLSSGFWLRSHSFYEQPVVQFTYEYLLVAETDDPTVSIQCGATNESFGDFMKNEENCVEFQVSFYLKHAHVFRCYFNQACLPKLSRYFI